MDISDLKEIQNSFQIISLIGKGSPFGGEFWQSPKLTSEREMARIVQIYVDERFEKVIFRFSGLIEVDRFQPIYIRLSYRNLIFRLMPDEYKVRGDKLICNYPKIARALEERRGERYILPIDEGASLSLKRVERSVREMTYDLELRILDVSKSGLGILISGQNSDYLRAHDLIWLRSVEQKVLDNPILGTVCYVSRHGYFLKRGDMRVGISLNMPLKEENFSRLIKKSILIQY